METNIPYTYHHFNNYGFLMCDLDDSHLSPIIEEINEIQSNFTAGQKFNNRLAGNIRKEYQLSKCFQHVENLLLPFVSEYDEKFGYFKTIKYTSSDVPVRLYDVWANFQQKYEFNPLHDHAGVMSFVIWIKIPFTREEEDKFMPEVPSDRKCSGFFTLFYTDSLGNIKSHDFPADKKYEKKLLIFPATMRHCVYPFYTSDEYRISVAGNFVLRTN